MADLITVLGGTGFIGGNFQRQALALGYDCSAPGKGDPGIFQRDLGHVLYSIGLTADFRTRPLETVEAHVCLLRKLIEIGNFTSLTYISSTRLYAGAPSTAESATLRVNPNESGDLYNISKLMGESLCLHCGRGGFKVARLSNIVGLRSDPDIFIDQLLEEGCRNGHVALRTSLESQKDYLYIDDAVKLLLNITLSEERGIFNVASGEGISNREIVRYLEREMGFKVSVAPDAARWDFTAIDVARVRSLFDFSPQPFSLYFPKFLQAYRQKKGGK